MTTKLPVGRRFACRRRAALAGGVSRSAPGLFFSLIRRVTGRQAAGKTTTHGKARRRMTDREANLVMAHTALTALTPNDTANAILWHLRSRDMPEAQLAELEHQIGRLAHQKGREKEL